MKTSLSALLLLAALGCGSQPQTPQTSSTERSNPVVPGTLERSTGAEQETAPADVGKSADRVAGGNAGQPPAAVAEAPAGDLEQAAGQVLQLMVAGKYEEATKDFDTQVSQAMPPEKLKQTWEAVTAQVGALQEQTAVRRSQSGAHMVIDVDCTFEKSPLVFRLAFDQEHKIAGMFFLPPQENTAPATESVAEEKGSAPQSPPRVGVWKPFKAELGGEDLPEAIMQAMTLTLTADTYATQVKGGQGSDSGTYKVDEQANPKRLTITSTNGANKGKSQFAIYEITEGGVLRICYDLAGKDFPEEFKTGQGTQRFLADYRRQKLQGAKPETPE